MILAKKGQIIVLDVLIFIILILLVISIEIYIFNNYKENIKYEEEIFRFVEEDYFIDSYLLDCNYFGYLDNKTKKCHKNKIDIKDKQSISEKFCKIKIDDTEIINKNKRILSTHRKGVVYKNKFSVMEVSFCEK